MNTDETISAFINFYRDRGHQPIRGGSLLSPPGDPVLFTSAGMHPLTPYLAGRPHPLGRRLTGVQRCLRTTDLDEVGDYSHLTVFQMLGSWSLGDYDGPQSQRWGLDLLREVFGLERGLLYATVFGGDEQVGPDTAAQQTWDELGLPAELLGPEDNWWSNGPTGPCGPDSEIHVWTGDGPPSGSPSTDAPLAGAVEPRHDALRAAPGRQPDSAPAAQRRYRHGPGAAADGDAARALGVRDRPVRAVAVGAARAVADRPAVARGSWPITCGRRSSSSAMASGRPTPAAVTYCEGCCAGR